MRFDVVSPASGAGRAALWGYTEDIVGRYHGRPAVPAEVAAALAEDPSHDLAAPHGLFLVARDGDEVLGCVGLRFVDAGEGGHTAEVKRLFVTPAARGRGVGAALLGHLEALAAARGIRRLRLDTRADLVEARRLYARCGYREVAPFNDGRYAEHWYAKELQAG